MPYIEKDNTQSQTTNKKPALTSKLFLNALVHDYPDGYVNLQVSKVTKPFKSKYGRHQVIIGMTILDDVESFVRIIKSNGEPAQEQNPFGELVDKVERKHVKGMKVDMFYNIEPLQENEIRIKPNTNLFTLVNTKLAMEDPLFMTNNNSIVMTGKDMQDLIGFKFKAKGKRQHFENGNKFNMLDIAVLGSGE